MAGRTAITRAGSSLGEQLGQVLTSQENSDIIVSVEGRRFHLHRVILQVRSQFFDALLRGGWKDKEDASIQGWTAQTFERFLPFLYTDTLPTPVFEDWSFADWREVIGLSRFLQVDGFTKYLGEEDEPCYPPACPAAWRGGRGIPRWTYRLDKTIPKEAFHLSYEAARDRAGSQFDFLLDALDGFAGFPDIAQDAWYRCVSDRSVRNVVLSSRRGFGSLAVELRENLTAELGELFVSAEPVLDDVTEAKRRFEDMLGAPVLIEVAKEFGPLKVLREVHTICAGVYAAAVVVVRSSSHPLGILVDELDYDQVDSVIQETKSNRFSAVREVLETAPRVLLDELEKLEDSGRGRSHKHQRTT